MSYCVELVPYPNHVLWMFNRHKKKLYRLWKVVLHSNVQHCLPIFVIVACSRVFKRRSFGHENTLRMYSVIVTIFHRLDFNERVFIFYDWLNFLKPEKRVAAAAALYLVSFPFYCLHFIIAILNTISALVLSTRRIQRNEMCYEQGIFECCFTHWECCEGTFIKPTAR